MTEMDKKIDSPKALEAGVVEPAAVDNATEDNSLLVTWNGDNDPENPFNWSPARKWGLTILLSFGGLVTLMSGSMLAPALPSISHDLGTSEDSAALFLSIFVLSFALGPLVLAPLTEVFGRRPIWLFSGCFYILWSTVAGFSKSPGLMIASRLLGGIGASAEFAVSYPVLGDTWAPSERGLSFSIATFIPLLGPALGPIIGGAISDTVGWRWLFWTLSIYDGILVILCFFFFKETYGVIILHRRAQHLRKTTGKPYHTAAEDFHDTLSQKLSRSLTRPFRLIVSEPTLQIMSIFLAFNFGTLYIVLSTFASMWIERYGQTQAQSGLNYLAIVIGYTVASQGGARLTDWLWAYLKARSGTGDTAPEYRVPLMVPGAVLIPAGLLVYGWAAEYRVHWVVPDLGIAVFGCGIILSTQAMLAYVMDAYSKYVASASAASSTLRMVAGFAFPLFAPVMYRNLGYGWGNTLIALLFLVMGVPAPIFLWYYGAKLRARGKAQG